MWIFDMFDSNACSIHWRNNGLEAWTWDEYYEKKKEFWEKIVLVDMINHPVDDSVIISDKLFSWIYPEGTIFALYCHSGWSSWYLQKQLVPAMPMYTFVNIKWGILSK